MIPRQCYARIIADVQDASPFPCANWILRQFPGGQRPCARQHDLHPGHAWRDIAATNADEIGPALDALIGLLQDLRKDLPEGERLADVFTDAARWRGGIKK